MINYNRIVSNHIRHIKKKATAKSRPVKKNTPASTALQCLHTDCQNLTIKFSHFHRIQR